ncbi:hypothetical protein [Romboutsia lituseburensis]|nr:hypothetical protein [Romboutsia lituseburensis]MCR8745028.1 hypothetical protein [Romboutsia lituseburensis]
MKLQSDFEIAHLTEKEESAIKKAENELKNETGKDFVVIAWEKISK